MQSVIKNCYYRYRLQHSNTIELRRGSRSTSNYCSMKNGSTTKRNGSNTTNGKNGFTNDTLTTSGGDNTMYQKDSIVIKNSQNVKLLLNNVCLNLIHLVLKKIYKNLL